MMMMMMMSDLLFLHAMQTRFCSENSTIVVDAVCASPFLSGNWYSFYLKTQARKDEVCLHDA